jgi:hypothetical protein
MRTNRATGQQYPDRIREQDYAVLAVAPGLPATPVTEVALVWMRDGSYSTIHMNKMGYVLEDNPIFTDREVVAQHVFAYRTQDNFAQKDSE